jgi:hypothetical protein
VWATSFISCERTASMAAIRKKMIGAVRATAAPAISIGVSVPANSPRLPPVSSHKRVASPPTHRIEARLASR